MPKTIHCRRGFAIRWAVIFNNPPINLLDPDTIREPRQLIATVEAADALISSLITT